MNIKQTTQTRSIDAGLRHHMLGIYNYMTGGLAVTTVFAYMLLNTSLGNIFLTAEGQLTGIGMVGSFVPLALIIFMMFKAHTMSTSAVQMIFWTFSACFGITLASVLVQYTGVSVTRTLLVTTATFGAMSLYGYTTKKDLSGLGNFLFMGMIGLMIAMIVNIFLGSSVMHFITSCIGVLLFTVLTAYNTQQLKREYHMFAGQTEILRRSAVLGAISLYLDFINLFLFLLQFLGDRK